MDGAIVLLNGYPGIGKTSVAKELAELLPNAQVVDIGALDRLARVHPERSEDNLALRKDLRQTLLLSLTSHHPPPDALHQPPIYIIPDTLYSTIAHRKLLSLYPALCAEYHFTLISIVLPLPTLEHVARAKTKGYTEGEIMLLRMMEDVGHVNSFKKILCKEWEVVTEGLDRKGAAARVIEYVLDGLRASNWFVMLKRPKAPARR